MKSLFLVLLIFYIFLPQSPIFYFRELGYVRASQETIESHFGQVSDEFAMDDVQCSGNETSIFDCPHQTIDNCGGSEGLGVICSGEYNQRSGIRYPSNYSHSDQRKVQNNKKKTLKKIINWARVGSSKIEGLI